MQQTEVTMSATCTRPHDQSHQTADSDAKQILKFTDHHVFGGASVLD